MIKLALASLLLLLLIACSPPSGASDSANDRADRMGEEAMAIVNAMDETELQVLTKRVMALERKIAELETDPQIVELQLLQARLRTVEAKVLTSTRGADGKASTDRPKVETGANQPSE